MENKTSRMGVICVLDLYTPLRNLVDAAFSKAIKETIHPSPWPLLFLAQYESKPCDYDLIKDKYVNNFSI